MNIKLLETVQIPDENWDAERAEKGAKRPTATNYRGAILGVSDELAEDLIAAGKAEQYTPPKPADTPAAETGTVAGPASDDSDAGRAAANFGGRPE